MMIDYVKNRDDFNLGYDEIASCSRSISNKSFFLAKDD